MTIWTASGTIYVHSPDHPKRSQIISPVAVFGVGNVCRRVLGLPARDPQQRCIQYQGAYCVKTESRQAFAWQGEQVSSAALVPGLPSLSKCV
jgi:hypothetical protein